jgi:hypothetical protein
MKFLPVLLGTLGLALGSQDFGISVFGFGIWRLFAVVLLEGVVLGGDGGMMQEGAAKTEGHLTAAAAVGAVCEATLASSCCVHGGLCKGFMVELQSHRHPSENKIRLCDSSAENGEPPPSLSIYLRG